MQHVIEMNEQRGNALESYSSLRSDHLECHCLSHKKADIVIRADYQAPNKKVFTIVSESGSGTVRNKVFKKLLEAEQESMRECVVLRSDRGTPLIVACSSHFVHAHELTFNVARAC